MHRAFQTGLTGLCLVFLLGWQAVEAADYRDWVPLLPDSLDGLEPAGEPEGVNAESGDRSWSSLRQRYSGGGGQEVTLNIVTGSQTPAHRQFQALSKLHIENEQQLIKSLDISGHKAVLNLNKQGNSGDLTIFLEPQTLVLIEAEPVADEKALTSLAAEIPLQEIGEQVP
jgi:hypothetical protein